VDTKNQLTNATPVGTQAYDGNGNVTASQSGSQTFSYDDENRLTTNELAYTTRNVFTYDGLGRLRQRQEYAWAGTPYFYWYATETVRYVYDGMRVIQERNEVNTPQVSYTRGNDLSGSLEGAGGIGGLLARSHGYSSGNWSTHNCYHADGNGNITYLVNSSQTLAASYLYDPYGNTISSSGSLASANVYRFSSKEFHVNSGLYYYGYRWYHPNLQRWLNRDHIGEKGGINLFQLVSNNPVNKIDSLGLAAEPGEENITDCLKKCLSDYRKVKPLRQACGDHAVEHAVLITATGTSCVLAFAAHGKSLVLDIACVGFAGLEIVMAGITVSHMEKIAEVARQDFVRCIWRCGSKYRDLDTARDFWEIYRPITPKHALKSPK
jgi:RHS repeat-associated protein